MEKNTPENKEYFRKLTQLIELKITNLGETKFPLIRPTRGITSEGSSITPKGFSMDIDRLSPLGRTGIFELIGTPKELAQFQTEEWLSKHDAEIILVNAMTRPGFLMGDYHLLDQYEAHLHKILNSEIEKLKFSQKFKLEHRLRIREKRALDLMIGYVTEFEPHLDLDKIELRGFDVKRELYRLPHTVINALALYYNVPQKNTLEQLDALTKKKIFNPENSAHLKKLLTQAVQWRVETHLFYKTEKEIFYTTKEGEDLSGERLFLITLEIRETLQEMYRTLYPLHRATKAFTKGNVKAFQEIPLYDPDIGTINLQLEEDVRYLKAKSSHEKALALDPNNPEALQVYDCIKEQLDESKETLKYHQEQLLILKRKHGDGPKEEIATTLSDLGRAYYSLGEASKAIEYFSQALAMEREIFGGRAHPLIATSLSNLGLAYDSLGGFSKAIEYYAQALTMYKEIFGSITHPDIAICLGNLGAAYCSLGEHSNAIAYYTQALAIQKEIFGSIAHPDIATSLSNLGAAYCSLGETSKAIEYPSQALAMRREIFGSKAHPDIATSLGHLGNAYYSLGETSKAIEYHCQALAMKKEIFGNIAHPSIANSLGNLGNAYHSLGETSKAIEYHCQALTMKKEIFGSIAHPSIADSLGNLGVAYYSLGENSKAIEYFSQALAMGKEIYGSSDIHPVIANSLAWLRLAREALEKQQSKF